MLESANQQLLELKSQLEDQQKEEAEETPSKEIVEEALSEQEEDLPEDLPSDDANESPEEEKGESEESDGGDEEPPKDNKGWAKMRHRLKEKDSEIEELKETMRQIQLQVAEQKGRQDALLQPKPEIEADPEPDPILDPEEHTAWVLRQKDKEINALKSTQEQHSAFIQQQNDRYAIQSLEGDYKRRNPDIDYDAAKNFLKDRERKILKLQGYTESQIDQHFMQYEMDLFKSLAVKGQNATDVIVSMAKEYGYQPKTNEPQSKKKPNLEAIKKNQEKNASLIGGSDVVQEHGVTPEALVNMSMDQLVAGGKDLFKKAHKNIEGRER